LANDNDKEFALTSESGDPDVVAFECAMLKEEKMLRVKKWSNQLHHHQDKGKS